MFKKSAAIKEAAGIISSQIESALDEASMDQLLIIKSGGKWRSTFVLGYFTGILSIAFQNRDLEGLVSGVDVKKVARKVYGRSLEVVLDGLIAQMDSEKAKKEYEHGQNAAVMEDWSQSQSMFKQYLLGLFDFDEEGELLHQNRND